MSDQINEFKTWLKEHIEKNRTKADDNNKSERMSVFHLGARLAFELTLEEFDKKFNIN
jgi:hypothetical protein